MENRKTNQMDRLETRTLLNQQYISLTMTDPIIYPEEQNPEVQILLKTYNSQTNGRVSFLLLLLD